MHVAFGEGQSIGLKVSAGLVRAQDMQRKALGAAEAALAPHLAEFLTLLPAQLRCEDVDFRGEVLQPLLTNLLACASWRVRDAATRQLRPLAACLSMEVRAFMRLGSSWLWTAWQRELTSFQQLCRLQCVVWVTPLPLD